uniref:Uncharacterized protein n=1 Tax=Ditylenchus dipsaci TaxID=166011 RepID=A0A915E2R3_9BILA
MKRRATLRERAEESGRPKAPMSAYAIYIKEFYEQQDEMPSDLPKSQKLMSEAAESGSLCLPKTKRSMRSRRSRLGRKKKVPKAPKVVQPASKESPATKVKKTTAKDAEATTKKSKEPKPKKI